MMKAVLLAVHGVCNTAYTVDCPFNTYLSKIKYVHKCWHYFLPGCYSGAFERYALQDCMNIIYGEIFKLTQNYGIPLLF